MQQVQEFILTYWKELLLCVEVVLAILFFCLKKRPVSNVDDRIKVIIDDCLTYYVNLAETSFTSGNDKLFFVTGEVLKRIKHYYHTIDESFWTSFIMDRIEKLLSTPQKKEK